MKLFLFYHIVTTFAGIEKSKIIGCLCSNFDFEMLDTLPILKLTTFYLESILIIAAYYTV